MNELQTIQSKIHEIRGQRAVLAHSRSQIVTLNTAQLRKDFEELKLDIEDILRDQNDINESTRLQLDAISTALAEMHSKEPRQKPRRRIGFIQEEYNIE